MLRRTKADEVSDPREGVPARGIVVAADDPDGLALLKRLLESTGEAVEAIGDTASAVVAVVASPRRALVLAFGNQAPAANRKAVEAVRRQLDPVAASTPIVVVADDEHHVLATWQAGIDDHLVRPVRADALVATVTAATTRTERERRDHRRQGLNRARAAAIADPDQA